MQSFILNLLLVGGALLLDLPPKDLDANVFYSAPDVVTPKLTHKEEPIYSGAARTALIQGNVLMELIIDEVGVPRDLVIVSPLGYGLDQLAIECVSKWRFDAATKNDKPVKFRAMIEVSFRIAGRPFDSRAEDRRMQSNQVAALLAHQGNANLSEYSREKIQDLARHRVAAAEYVVGLWKLKGDVLKKDEGAALKDIQSAAKADFAPALLFLGNAQIEGKLIPRNLKAGLARLKRAAALGNTDAQFSLGKRYMDSDGVDADVNLAKKYLQACAHSGKSECQSRMEQISNRSSQNPSSEPKR